MPRERPEWIFVWPCDCPFGVMEGYLAENEDQAFEVMFEGMIDARRHAESRGLVTRLITWNEYENRYCPKMNAACTHQGEAQS